MDKLTEIYTNLQSGKAYGKYEAMRFPFFHIALYSGMNGKFIHWNHSGSSANENTPENLAWILENIFKMTPEQFTEEYSIYDESDFREWEKIAESQNTGEYRTGKK